MLIIRYTGAEEKAKEPRKLLLRPILLPPSVTPASGPASLLPSTPALGPASQLPSTPASCPASQPPSTPVLGPASQPPSTPASCLASQLPSTPASCLASQPPSTPASCLASQPPSTPASCLASQPPSTPASCLASQPPSTPASCLASQPPSTPASCLASQPPSTPTLGPASQPPSTPASCLASQPPSTPASCLASQPPSTPASCLASQPPSTPASGLASQPPSTPASCIASQPPSTPASCLASQPPSTPASCFASQPPSTPASGRASQLPSTPASCLTSQAPSTPASCLASQLPSTPAGTPATCTPATPSNRYQSTKQLVDLQMKKRKYQSCGRKFASRPLANRMKQQNERLYLLAKEIHLGNKEDLLTGIAHSVSSVNSKLKDDTEWDGQLTVQDIVKLAMKSHDSRKGKSVYELLTHDAASKVHHISSLKVLKMQDSISQKETFRTLRKLLPGFIDSERRTEQLKYKWHKEFEVVLQPTRTKTGWRINPERLRKCVSFVYPWLKDVDTEWWRLYGDARNFGGQKSVLLSLSVLNNEAMFNGCSFQSPEENSWPIHIFYGPDSRLNLELNIGDGDGYLNTWIDSMTQEGHKTFVASDNMFANAILGGGLDPKSNDNFSIYAFETTSTRSEVGANTGVRSELNRQIEREHPESLLPAIPTSHFIPCANHMFVRITEHLLTLRVMSCLNEGVVNSDRSGTLSKLLSNINIRGVRGGNFQLKFDGPKLEPVSLNVSHAETISAPPEAFHTEFPHILDGVAQHEQFPQTLSSGLQSALDWPTNTITYYDLEKKIWETHWRMHVLCRKDPDPRLSESSLLPGSSAGSQNARDYRFGLLDSEIEEYTRLGDLHHGLMLLRYGSSRLYPYLMTRVDIVPLLLKELPFHSLFRGST